ncbi:Cdc25 phosphatase Ibp1 [Umbelopsis nana]
MSFKAPLVNDSEIIKLLRDKTKVPRKDYVIIDVRDHDFEGGNIPGSVNVPSQHFIDSVQKLIEEYKNVPQVAVLKGGFEQWYLKHRNDPTLIENHDPEVWKGLLYEYGFEE